MSAVYATSRDEIEPKMRQIRPLSEPVIDFGIAGVMLDLPDEVEEYVTGDEPDPQVIRGCGPLLNGDWVAIEALLGEQTWRDSQFWQVRRFIRVADRGEALDNLALWEQIATRDAS